MNKTKTVRRGRVVYLYEMINNVWKLVKVTCALLVVLGCANSYAQPINEHKAILTIIGEDENNLNGMKYVASTIRNRHTLRGAYGLHSPRVINHLYSAKSLKMATLSWEWSKTHNLGCTYWFSDQDLNTDKVKHLIDKEELVLVARIGHGIYYNNFYRKATPTERQYFVTSNLF